VQYFLNLIHISKIIYLFFITCQALPHGYDSLLGVHLILVGYSIVRSSSCFHDPLDLVFVHHNWVQGILLLSFIPFSFHFSLSYQCFPCYSRICLTIAILHRGPFSISLCRLINPLLINPEPKKYIFPHIRFLTSLQDAYTLAAPLQLTYILICSRKYKMKSGFYVTTKVSNLWPSIYWKRSDSALHLHSGGYKSTISSYG
jgi:hypothetical protein